MLMCLCCLPWFPREAAAEVGGGLGVGGMDGAGGGEDGQGGGGVQGQVHGGPAEQDEAD